MASAASEKRGEKEADAKQSVKDCSKHDQGSLPALLKNTEEEHAKSQFQEDLFENINNPEGNFELSEALSLATVSLVEKL